MRNKIGIYPGTFDPITYGHIDVIKRALSIVDSLVIAIADNDNKGYFFTSEERVKIVSDTLKRDIKLKKNKIKIISFDTLTLNLCNQHKAKIIFRGLRAVSDFEYEFQLAGMNRRLDKSIETVFLMSEPESQVISSKLVKEIAFHHGSIKKFTTRTVIKAIKDKLR